MSPRILLVLVGVVVMASAMTKYQLSFDEYCKVHNKNYEAGSPEYFKRASLYASRVKMIAEHNTKDGVHHEAVNKFADWTEEELASMRGYKAAGRRSHGIPMAAVTPAKLGDLPASVDWRAKGKVTPIKDQGQCGSCWAFAGTASIESDLAIEQNKLMSLSEQEYVSCAPNPRECGGTGGCQGATPDILFDYAIKSGSASEAAYPYTSGTGNNGQCAMASKKPVAFIHNYTDVTSNSEQALMVAVAQQPTTIAVDASKWSFYSGGIFDKCGWILDHAVLVVGYGGEGKDLYWIVKNSWGPNWGENGYIRLRRYGSQQDVPCGTNTDPSQGVACKGDPKTEHVCGTCGMYYAPSYPTGATLA